MNYGYFIQRVDALVILLWTLSIFCYLSISVFIVNRTLKKVSHVVNEKMFSYPICCILFGMSLIPLNVSQIKFIEDTLYKFTIIGFVFIFCLVVLFLANIKFKLKKGKLKA